MGHATAPVVDAKHLDDMLARIGKLEAEQRRLNPRAPFFARVDPVRGNLEYLIGPDLGHNLLPQSDSGEERAARLIVELDRDYKVIGLGAEALAAQLAHKHTLRSQMGAHHIFALRHAGDELVETFFAVHFDQQGRAVALFSVYEPTMPPQSGQVKLNLTTLSEKLRPSIASQGVTIERQMAPRWEKGAYEPEVRVKRADGKSMIERFDAEGNEIGKKSLAVKAGPGFLTLGRVYQQPWTRDEKDREGSPKARRPVTLRGLGSDRDLTGEYVAVRDMISSLWPLLGAAELQAQLNQPLEESTLFDRVMAYYHVDRIQRYFRTLGLYELDRHPHMRPIFIVLSRIGDGTSDDGIPRYLPNEQRILICQIAPDFAFTQAREPRVLYHEFVHAVTDAIARLQRAQDYTVDNPRYMLMAQAQAMDEGLGDYFACSLTVQDGAEEAEFGMLTLDGQTVCSNGLARRKLGTRYEVEAPPNLSAPAGFGSSNPDRLPGDEEKYAWGLEWGRFLWQLRVEVFGDAEIADMVVAHSIFFLSRWSSFGAGVLALALADRLLFDGVHEAAILAHGAAVKEWAQGTRTSGDARPRMEQAG